MKELLLLLYHAVRKAQRDQVKDLAAAIAFWTFFSIFPLLIGILSLSGHFLKSEAIQAQIFRAVADMFPGSADLVKENIDSVVTNRGSMGFIGIGGLLLTASKGIGAVTRAVNRALGLEQNQSFLFLRLRYFLMTVLVAVLSIASIAVTVFAEVALKSSLLTRLGLGDLQMPRVNGFIASFVFVFLVCCLIYKLTPHTQVTWFQVLPGALLAAILFELGKAAFIFYLEKATFSAVYGSLSSIIGLLLWLYISAWMLILGAEFNIVLHQRRAQAE